MCTDAQIYFFGQKKRKRVPAVYFHMVLYEPVLYESCVLRTQYCTNPVPVLYEPGTLKNPFQKIPYFILHWLPFSTLSIQHVQLPLCDRAVALFSFQMFLARSFSTTFTKAPLLVATTMTTGKSGRTFGRVQSVIEEMIREEMNQLIPPPLFIITDLDRVYLNFFARSAGHSNYKEWLSFMWKKAVEAYRIYKDTLQSLKAAALVGESIFAFIVGFLRLLLLFVGFLRLICVVSQSSLSRPLPPPPPPPPPTPPTSTSTPTPPPRRVRPERPRAD